MGRNCSGEGVGGGLRWRLSPSTMILCTRLPISPNSQVEKFVKGTMAAVNLTNFLG